MQGGRNGCRIYNVFGQKVFECNLSGGVMSIDTGKWTKGMYMIQLRQKAWKFVKIN